MTSPTGPVCNGQRSLMRRFFPIHGLLALVIVFLAGSGAGARVATNKDLNGDGRVDAVFTQKQRYNQVCFGDGTGAFTSCRDITGAGDFILSNQLNTTASALVDWDNDGDLDIILAIEGRTNVVCYNDGAGDFNNGLGCIDIDNMPYNTEGLAVGDIDGDGAPDVVFANGGNAGLPLNQPNVACFGANTGSSVCQEFGTNAPSTGVALADLNGDGRLDVIVSNRGTQNEVCLNGGRAGSSISFDCRAIPQASTVSATKISNAVATGNLSLNFAPPDAYRDVVFANDGKNEICMGTGDWSGQNVGLSCSEQRTASSYTFNDATARSVAVVVSDFYASVPGDEIVFANTDAPNAACFAVFYCSLTFQPLQTVNFNGTMVAEPTLEVSTGLAIQDINMDGRKDLVVANDPTSRTFPAAYAFSSSSAVVANGTLHPTSVTLSGGTVGPAVADTTPPQFFGAANKTAEATGPNGAVVTFSPTASDLVDGAVPVTCAPASGSLFALGNTTVSCTAKDKANNTGTATFTVSVVDTTGPAITVPADITVVAPMGQASTAVTFSVSGLDLVDGVQRTDCYNPATGFGVLSGEQFPGGTTILMCGAFDAHHNYNERPLSITVITDLDSDGILDNVDPDDDNDGIMDTVDTAPTTVSNGYRLNDTVFGTVTRNGFSVSIAPLPPPVSGPTLWAMRASISGNGSRAAVITANCGGSTKELRLDGATESVDWRCDGTSLTAHFLSGTPEFWKRTCSGGACAWVKITPTGTPSVATAGSPVVADPSNTDPISVTIYDDNLVPIGSFTLDPSESVDVSVVPGPNNEPLLQLTVLNGGPDGTVTVQLLGQTLNLQSGAGPQTYDMHPDFTAPLVAAQVNGTLGNNGFYTSDVTVTWSVNEPDSAVTSTGCDTQTVLFDTFGTTFTCTATSKGGTTTESVTIKRDATAPTIAGSRTAPNAAGWYNGPATVSFTCNDFTSGVASCSGSTTLTADGAGQSVTGTVTDLAGNTATRTISGINIDTTAPIITVPGNIVASATGANGAVVTYAASVQDALDSAAVVSCTPASGSTFAIGMTLVICTSTDAAGNLASAKFKVTVQDTTAPTIEPAVNVTAEATSPAGAAVNYVAPTTHDIVDGDGTAVCLPASGSVFPIGQTNVTCMATDAHGNEADPVILTVTVQDTTAPTIDPHAALTSEATSAAGAVVTYSAPATHDIVDPAGTASCAPVSGSTFAVGTTTVTCTATDAHGNAATPVTFTVTVQDTTAPTIDAHAAVTAQATSAAGAAVTYSAPATHDIVDPTGTATCAPASGSTFAIGSTTVTCTATDAHGNAATPVTFTVTVQDTTAPTIDAHAAVTAQATSAAGATVSYSAPATHDAVDSNGASACLPASGSMFAIGSTTVTCTATDAHGNAATPVSFTVTVEDTTAPTIDAMSNVTAAATNTTGAVVTYTAPATHDTVDGNGTANCAPTSGSTFAVGNTTVTCTATDAHGNVATPISFTVTVTAPPAVTPGHMKGEGSVRGNNKRYEFKFDVREDSRGEQGNLRLTVKDESKGKDRDRADEFMARTVSSVAFSDDPTDRPGRSKRPQVDTVLFSGVGSWNGVAGYSYEVFAQDAGEPGRHRESIRITIRNSSGAIVASVDGVLTDGNVQSFRIKH